MDELEVRDILRDSSFPYLAAFEGEWIDADRRTLSFDEMGREHLQSCLKMLKKQKYTIEHGFFLEGVDFDEEKYEDIVEITKKLYCKKVEELKEYLG